MYTHTHTHTGLIYKYMLYVAYIHTGASQVLLVVKIPSPNAQDIRNGNSVPGLGRSPEGSGGNGYPLQCSYLENPLNREAWRATVPGVTKSQTRLSD